MIIEQLLNASEVVDDQPSAQQPQQQRQPPVQESVRPPQEEEHPSDQENNHRHNNLVGAQSQSQLHPSFTSTLPSLPVLLAQRKRKRAPEQEPTPMPEPLRPIRSPPTGKKARSQSRSPIHPNIDSSMPDVFAKDSHLTMTQLAISLPKPPPQVAAPALIPTALPTPSQAPAPAPATIDPDLLCRYRNKKCMNLRAFKRNGKRHNLCEFHRTKANRNQRRLECKRRNQKRELREHEQEGGGNADEADRGSD